MFGTNRLGVVCRNPHELKDRLLVSDLQLLDGDAAAANGYGQREVIIPAEPRQPTDSEAAALAANPETRHVLRLVSLPRSIGEIAMQVAGLEKEFHAGPANFVDLGAGFLATDIGIRDDAPGQVNVSKDNDDLKVGDHIDCMADASYRIAVLNMGPGVRYHRLTPSFSRDDLHGQLPVPNVRNTHLKNMSDVQRGSLLAYWIRLDPPSPDPEPTVDALIFSPVARYLHDGATTNAQASSTAVFIASPLKTHDTALNPYLSLV